MHCQMQYSATPTPVYIWILKSLITLSRFSFIDRIFSIVKVINHKIPLTNTPRNLFSLQQIDAVAYNGIASHARRCGQVFFCQILGIFLRLKTPNKNSQINGNDNSKFIVSFAPRLKTGRNEKNTTIGSSHNSPCSILFSQFAIDKFL